MGSLPTEVSKVAVTTMGGRYFEDARGTPIVPSRATESGKASTEGSNTFAPED
jgi:hypothetical protein